RRFKQLNEKGLDVNLSSLILDIEARDTRDMNRKEAPLKAASDAIILDTSDLSINEVVAQVLMIVRENTG
ncbi:MAG: (d)CMP kinase, partial [Cocleimonas sp.]|nr:(d)CMP kinase [Cocleimonas sp.]